MNITCPNCGTNPVKMLGLAAAPNSEAGAPPRIVKHVKCPSCGNTGSVDADGASWSKNAKKADAPNAPVAPVTKTSVASPANTTSRYMPKGTQ